MNTEPFLASTLVPWTANGPTALPHADALAVDPPSPSGSSSTTTSSGASTSATPQARACQFIRHPGRQPPPRPGPAGVMDPFHVATESCLLSPWPPGRELRFRYRVVGQARAWVRRDNNALLIPGAGS